jgi:AraC family transcriptional regulator of arabinose operon
MSERAKLSAWQGIGHSERVAADHRIRKVMQAIEADPSLDIPGLARMVNLSSSRLSHLFKATTGFSLQTFLSNARLAASAKLLQSTEMPIKEISYSVGYRHAPSFVRAFRNKFGSSPNDYRNQQRLLLSDS